MFDLVIRGGVIVDGTGRERFEGDVAVEGRRICEIGDIAASGRREIDARGLLETTLVVVATEFGRTPRLDNGGTGRNHYPKAFTCLMAGGGIRGGQRWGDRNVPSSGSRSACPSVGPIWLQKGVP